jgi:hypothetical protein
MWWEFEESDQDVAVSAGLWTGVTDSGAIRSGLVPKLNPRTRMGLFSVAL